jgi:hypothetical protein
VDANTWGVNKKKKMYREIRRIFILEGFIIFTPFLIYSFSYPTAHECFLIIYHKKK